MRLTRWQARRGVITPLTAFSAIVLLGMVAFAVDLGWISVVRSDLQNAADAAALAGANPLMDGHVLYYLPLQTSTQKTTILNNALASARANAKQYAKNNGAGGVSSLTLLDSDIEFGFMDTSNKYTALPTYTEFPNTIKVTLRRDANANGALGLFFGPVLGLKTTDVKTTASATIYAGTIDNFNTKQKAGLLPLTYDVDAWNGFVKTGLNPDGLLMKDSSGNPTLEVYPSLLEKGNFGQISLDDTHVGESTEVAWVQNGPSTGDIQALKNASLIPLSQHGSKWDWLGETGFKSSLVMEINSHVGQVYTLPLFKAYNSSVLDYHAGSGQGSNYSYNVVQVVGVRIMPSPDSNRIIVVQPAADIDPAAVFSPSSIIPAPAQSTTTFASPKLTR